MGSYREAVKNMIRNITGILCALASVSLGIYSAMAFMNKGPILTNAVIWLSESEREKVDKKAEYRLAAVIFGGLSLAMAFETVYVFTYNKLAFCMMWICLVFDMGYAIWDAVRKLTKR